MLLSMSDLVTSVNIFMFIFNPKFNMNYNKNREFRKYPEAGLVSDALDIHPFHDSTLHQSRQFDVADQNWCNVVKRYDVVVRSVLPKNLIAYPCMQTSP